MIRINLGKDGIQDLKKKGVSSVLEKLGIPVSPKVTKYLEKKSDQVTLLIFYSIALAVAALPFIVLDQYQAAVRARHARNMKELEKQIKLVDAEISKYSAFQRELESFEKQKATLSERLSTIRALQKGRGLAVMFLDAVGQSLPRKVWLHSVKYNLLGDAGNVSLNGEGLGSEDVSDFVDKLQDSVYFELVKLVGVQPSKTGTITTKSFTIDIKTRALASMADSLTQK